MNFKDMLEKVIDIPIHLIDERLSTIEAEKLLISADVSRKKRKKVIDGMAASIILDTYLKMKGWENMKEEKKGTFTIVNDEGKTLECEVLFTFDSDETNKSYIVYTDNTQDDEGNLKVYANTYDPSGKDQELKPITEDKEWQVIENILASLHEKIGE